MKKLFILFILLITLFFSSIVSSEERTDENNYLVNKKWEITSNNLSNVLSTPHVDASKKIYDYADILSEEEENELFDLMIKFKNKTKIDIVFLSFDKEYSNDSINDDYAADFYDYNDFGIDTQHYDGILLYRNKYSSDPYFNILTFGEAILYYDYDRCESMLDSIYPYFVSKDYINGVKVFINEANQFYDYGKVSEEFIIDDNGRPQLIEDNTYHAPIVGSTLSAMITSILTVLGLKKKNKMVKSPVNANSYFSKEGLNFLNKNDNLISSITTHQIISDSSSSSSGGFNSGGGFGSSGGFHGGGGGRHG